MLIKESIYTIKDPIYPDPYCMIIVKNKKDEFQIQVDDKPLIRFVTLKETFSSFDSCQNYLVNLIYNHIGGQILAAVHIATETGFPTKNEWRQKRSLNPEE